LFLPEGRVREGMPAETTSELDKVPKSRSVALIVKSFGVRRREEALAKISYF